MGGSHHLVDANGELHYINGADLKSMAKFGGPD
jgi:hypothetical protein